MTVALTKTGFRKCGIFPLDRSAIDTSRLSGNSSNPPPTSSNLSKPNQPSSTDENTSLIADTSQEVSNVCTSTPEYSVLSNPLVLSGTVPASLIESFVFPDINVKGKKPPRVTTKEGLITSDEHVKAYNDKIQKVRLEQEAKENSSVIRQKGESQNGCFNKTKHAKFSGKRTFFTP